MSASSCCDSEDFTSSGSAASTESESSKRAAVKDCAENVEPYRRGGTSSSTGKFTQSGMHPERDAMNTDEYNQTTQYTSLNQPQLLLSSCPKDCGGECNLKLLGIDCP